MREVPDRDSVLAEIRAQARAARLRRGPSSVPSLRDAADLLAEAQGARRERQEWRARVPAPSSHRALAAPAIVAIKRALLRASAPLWARQEEFEETALEEVERLRERGHAAIDRLERRVERLESGRAGPSAPPRLDQRAFEERFRGRPGYVRDRLERHLRHLEPPACEPLLELGCGQGLFLDLARRRGIAARGVDLDRLAVARARGRGLEASAADAEAALRSTPDASLGSIVAFQVIEHLSAAKLARVLALSFRKLRPGGTLLLETVNVASGFALTRGWSIDPTHRLRLHPLALEGLVRRAGFSGVGLEWHGEVPAGERLEPDRSARRASLEWLFAPQDVTVVARR